MLPWLRLVRPAHWIKNLVCLAGIFFYERYEAWPAALGVMLSFILISSAVYILNDMVDVSRDRTHPKKQHRPLAAGQISLTAAGLGAVCLGLLGLVVGWWVHPPSGWCSFLYLLLNLAYSFRLKHLPIADAFCIALGFVLRLLAGIYVLDRLPVGWLVLFTFFLSLFLGFAKRRAELVALEDATDKTDRRPVLEHYSLSFLDGALDTSAALAILSYILLILLPTSLPMSPTQLITVPLLVFMILHYRRRLTHPKYRIEPNRIIYHDRVMQCCAVAWLALIPLVQRSGWRWFE